jgi:hypothetical protein
MTISYNLDIPDGPNNPSNDQPKMKTNTNSINTWTAIDHVEFGSAPAGSHKQTTFSSKNVPGAQTDPSSVLYTNSGTASTVAQPFFRNQNGIFQVSPIKAWGLVNGATGAIISSQSSNVSTVVRNSAGNYSVTLTANSVNSANFAVLLSYQNGFPAANTTRDPIYSITGAGTFNVFMAISSALTNDVVNFSFLVMQI